MKLLFFVFIALSWGLHSVPTLRQVSPGHHILTITECPCDDPPPNGGRTGCSCGKHVKQTKQSVLRDDGDADSDGDVDSYGDPDNSGDADNNGYTDESGVDAEYAAESSVTNGTTTAESTEPPFVSSYGSDPVAVPVTDLQLLNVYRGNDASDRIGIADYGDVLQNFQSGWQVWPNTTILFTVDDGVSNCVKTTLNVAVAVINTNTCVSLVQVAALPPVEQGPGTVLQVTENGVGCFSSLGWQPMENVVNIGSGCVNVGTVIHLLLHSLGLFHEHQRFDRDNFVTVQSGNIDLSRMGGSLASAKYGAVFGKSSGTNSTVWEQSLGSYDYGSIMHNGPCHYSTSEALGSDECVAASTLNSASVLTGNRDSLSQGDIAKVSAMYNCSVAPGVLLADPKSTQTTLCMLSDAADFEWAVLPPPSVNSSSPVVISSGSPNEAAAFQDPLRVSTDQKILTILIVGVVGVFLVAGLFIYLAHRHRAAKRTGRSTRVRRRAAEGSSDPLSQVVRVNQDEVGESTDSEVYAELLADAP